MKIIERANELVRIETEAKHMSYEFLYQKLRVSNEENISL